MEEKYVRIARFLESCTALIECDHRIAETKIAEILRSLSASKELVELFTAVTKGFNYGAARRIYLREPAETGTAHGAAYLPAERKDIVAFVFCLLVEFDAGSMRLDEFLLRYFYVDSSYTASFLIFTDRVIRPFRDIIADCFPELNEPDRAEAPVSDDGGPFARVPALVAAERSRLGGAPLGEEGIAAAGLIFGGLLSAAERRDAAAFSAVLAGYKYFLRYFGIEDVSELFTLAAKL